MDSGLLASCRHKIGSGFALDTQRCLIWNLEVGRDKSGALNQHGIFFVLEGSLF